MFSVGLYGMVADKQDSCDFIGGAAFHEKDIDERDIREVFNFQSIREVLACVEPHQ